MKDTTTRVGHSKTGENAELSDADEQELEEALIEIRRGNYTDGRELLNELKEPPTNRLSPLH